MSQQEFNFAGETVYLDSKEKIRGPPDRTIKIEAIGEFVYDKVKPRIRLNGYWLERAGFKAGHRVEIHLLKPGEMTLQFKEEPPPSTIG